MLGATLDIAVSQAQGQEEWGEEMYVGNLKIASGITGGPGDLKNPMTCVGLRRLL